MTGQPPPLVQKFLDKLSKSRDFSISLIVHGILVAVFGTMIWVKVIEEEPEIRASEGRFVVDRVKTPEKPKDTLKLPELPTNALTENTRRTEGFSPITTVNPAPINFEVGVLGADVVKVAPTLGDVQRTPQTSVSELTPETKRAIQEFSEVWRGSSKSTRGPEYQFTAYIGQYQGGNWNSTIRMSQGKIETGSLPNLLYLISHWTKDKVRTNYKNVQAIRLDSDELFATKPPFIFLTGTRDFVLTEKEVANLRNYLRVGGCVWGDSSVPGQNSRFDIAFKREMKRVVGGDQEFAPLPEGHPLFSQAYFKEIRSVPTGLNSYQLPVTALKMYGEVAVIYTANDYGDMWQIGLNAAGEIDLRRNASGQYVAINDTLYTQRDVYIRNISPESLEASFKFGANVVMHLLTRWQSRLGTSAPL